MRRPQSVSVKLSTLLSLMTILLIGVISIFASIIIYTDYKFNQASMERSENILVNGLLTGSMPLAVATKDKDLIKIIVEGQLVFDEIYAVSVISADGELLHRSEKESKSQVNIFSKTFDIVSSQTVTIDSFQDQPNSERILLGNVTISFSTESLYDKVKKQRLIAISLVAIAILICSILILSFNRLFTRQVNLITDLTDTIKSGKKLQQRDKQLIVNELNTIDENLYTMANTIYDRDAALTVALNNALEAKKAAQNAEEFKDEFIRAIAHDIKTPLGVVVNLLELINEESLTRKLDPALSQKIAACYKSATILADVTDELFNLEQFQSRELINRQTETNLSELFQKMSALYQHRFSERNITFKIQNTNVLSEQYPTSVLIDDKKLILILENIIDNALKFTKEGFVSVYWSTQGQSLLVIVRDSGIGIPDDKIPTIFEKHRQLGDQKTNRYQGRGLGLYYVKKLLEVMQGQSNVSSKIGLGTVFEISVPFGQVSTTPPLPVTLSNDSLKVLIIDDNELTCFALTSMLEKMGVQSTYECIPEIGYSRLVKEMPDLVFVDYHMPSLSGDELANRAKSVLLPHATILVCITAEQSIEKIRELRGIFDSVIQKPLKRESIEEVVSFAKNSKKVTDNFLIDPTDRK